jgi:pseudaminic acid cytidylyltransferase
MNIAIIPARGGSKRIPRKNIRPFYGFPIIAYAIKLAIECEIFSEVIVSTDDEEIAEVAISFGASVPWLRTSELSDDYATTVSVMQDAVKRLEDRYGTLENVCCIYPATPLLKCEQLKKALWVLKEGNWDYVIGVSGARTPPERFFSIGDNREIIMRFPEHETSRTQDLPQAYHDAGQFYWGKKISWETALPLFTSRSTIFELPSECAIDVDTLDDWHYAERIFGIYGKDRN